LVLYLLAGTFRDNLLGVRSECGMAALPESRFVVALEGHVGPIVHSPTTYSPRIPTEAWSDEHLVEVCLTGNEQAWAAVVDKYKGLVYCAAMQHKMSSKAAADLFQQVWSDLFGELGKLRKPGALSAWLISVVWHKCNRWPRDNDSNSTAHREIPFADWKEHAERILLLRETISQLPECCQRMVGLLFQWDPPIPYVEVARQLALDGERDGPRCTDCLDRLRTVLEQRGF
jgi:RNA polymerase sigma factor (sigma-70 family)